MGNGDVVMDDDVAVLVVVVPGVSVTPAVVVVMVVEDTALVVETAVVSPSTQSGVVTLFANTTNGVKASRATPSSGGGNTKGALYKAGAKPAWTITWAREVAAGGTCTTVMPTFAWTIAVPARAL